MASVVRMPSVLAGATEAAIAHWLVGPGDSVTPGTPIAEIETEKALVEYEAEEAGIVGRLVLGEGDSGEIGDPIAVLVAPGEGDADIDAALGGSSPGASSRQAQAEVSGAPGTDAPAANGSRAAANGGRIFASPLVRKLAGERGVDLAGLTGTGPNGRIVRRDLERFAGAGQAGPGVPGQPASAPVAPRGRTEATDTAPSPAVPWAATGTTAAASPGLGAGGSVDKGEAKSASVPRDDALARRPGADGRTGAADGTLIPHTPMRRAIARRLTESKAAIPHFYMVAECVVDEMLALRKRVNQTSPVKVSVNDFVVAAVAAAFADVPEANVIWTDEGLVAYRSVDISIAVATEAGLVTPVLRGVEGKKLSAIARESAALAQRARDRKLLQHELEGGTFAVSNLGMYGTAEFSAIINPPQSGILAVGAARQQAAVVDGAVAVATVMRCTLSVDHRAIDGALAARWLAAFTARLENPLGTVI